MQFELKVLIVTGIQNIPIYLFLERILLSLLSRLTVTINDYSKNRIILAEILVLINLYSSSVPRVTSPKDKNRY